MNGYLLFRFACITLLIIGLRPAAAQDPIEPIKVVPVRFCILNTGDMSMNNDRLDVRNLIRGLRQKNVIWAQCGLQFRLNRNAVHFIPDVFLPPSGIPGDVLDPVILIGEYLRVLAQCNEAGGEDALEKLNEIFIRSFVDILGNPDANTLGATIKPDTCRKPSVLSKPFMIDPSWMTPANFGITMAHENGHALSLDHTDMMGNLMFPDVQGGGLLLEPAQCAQARREAQKISGTVDKNSQGTPVPRSAPRTRIVTDDDNPATLQPWSDVLEYAATYEADKKLLSLTSLVVPGQEASSNQYLYRFMLDADNNPQTGFDPGALFEFPRSFAGADIYAELLVTYDPDPTILLHRAFAFSGGELILLEDIVADAAVFPIVNEAGETPGMVVLDIDFFWSLLPVILPLVEDFRSATTAECVGVPTSFDASPDLSGSITPFEEPTLIVINPVSGSAGSTVLINGKGFAPMTEVELSFDTLVVGTAMVDTDGKFETAITIPDNAGSAGPHSILAVDEEYASDVMLFRLVTGSAEPEGHVLLLVQNFPNPFSISTTIAYTLATPAPVQLSITNPLGQTVAVLESGGRPAGTHQAVWAPGPDVPAGIYFYTIRAGNRMEGGGRMVYLKG